LRNGQQAIRLIALLVVSCRWLLLSAGDQALFQITYIIPCFFAAMLKEIPARTPPHRTMVMRCVLLPIGRGPQTKVGRDLQGRQVRKSSMRSLFFGIPGHTRASAHPFPQRIPAALYYHLVNKCHAHLQKSIAFVCGSLGYMCVEFARIAGIARKLHTFNAQYQEPPHHLSHPQTAW
jgi:hypothetical protein